MKKSYYVLMLFSLLVVACSGSDDNKDNAAPPESAEVLYNKARDLMDEEDYDEAVKAFEEVERQHPYSELAPHSQIMAAFSQYQKRKYDEAITILDHYVKLYPGEESAPYAYYLIALCYYEQISDVGRDQKMTQLSLQALRDVIRRFPSSEYARDAKIKLDLTIDHLAGKEMEIGRYYLRHDDYVAAANRFRFVVENYETTTHAEEALYRLVEIYLKLGVVDEARHYGSVLGYNYPRSIWYRDAYRLLTGENPKTPTDEGGDKSWLDAITPW